MVRLHTFVFSPFQENTYVLYDDSAEAVIIDPGCYTQAEKDELTGFISQNGLKPVKLLNTHAHIDHVLGNAFVKRKYGIELFLHPKDLPLLRAVKTYAGNYGFPLYEEAEVDQFMEAGQLIRFGQSELEVRFVPGHAPGHVAFVNHADRFIIGGDVLFRRSIGRTDFPFSDFDTLAHSIRTEFYTLPDDYAVYPGHMEPTTIGLEKATNPFVKGV